MIQSGGLRRYYFNFYKDPLKTKYKFWLKSAWQLDEYGSGLFLNI